MLTSPRLCLALASVVAALAVAVPAPAVQLQVEAGPDCTTREELAARVAARTRRIDLVAPGSAPDASLVRVVITPGPRAVVGELTISQPAGPRAAGSPAVRRLSAPSCEQLTDALALLIALAFDPDTTAEPAAPPPNAPPTPPPAERVPPPPRPVPPPVASAAPPPAPRPVPAGRLRVSAAAGAQVLFGPAPHVMPGPTLDLTVGWDRPSVWSLAVRLSAALAWSGTLSETGGMADFSLDTLALDACPLRLAPWKLEARACANGTVGRLVATGSQTYQGQSVERPFAAAGGAALLTLPLGHALEISARASAGASWIRDSFAFAPKVFYRAAPLFLAAGLTAGVRFR
jgi:hypothetical protein